MARARRTLTDSEILSIVINSSAAKRMRGRGPEKRMDAVAPAGLFLWLAAAGTLFAIALSVALESDNWLKEHSHHCAQAVSPVKCTQRSESEVSGELQDVRHAADADPVNRSRP